jgi:hypothetical protein
MRQSNLYGFIGASRDKLIMELEALAKVKLKKSNNLDWGVYWSASEGGQEFRLYYNEDPMFDREEDDPEDFYFDFENKDCGFLLNIYGKQEWVEEMHKLVIDMGNIRAIDSKQHKDD